MSSWYSPWGSTWNATSSLVVIHGQLGRTLTDRLHNATYDHYGEAKWRFWVGTPEIFLCFLFGSTLLLIRTCRLCLLYNLPFGSAGGHFSPLSIACFPASRQRWSLSRILLCSRHSLPQFSLHSLPPKRFPPCPLSLTSLSSKSTNSRTFPTNALSNA